MECAISHKMSLNEAKNQVLNFLQFDDRTIIEISYLIDLANKLNITTKVHESIFMFVRPSGMTFNQFIKQCFFSDISWCLTEKVCLKYFPEIAIMYLEDFCLFFQDIYISDESHNQFYNWLATNDLRNLSVDAIVSKHFNELKKTYFMFDFEHVY